MIDQQGLYRLLDERHIEYEVCEHPAVYTIDELDALSILHKEQIVKNLFLRDDKKKSYYLVTMPGHKSINLKSLSAKIPSRPLSFAREETLRELLSLEKGHVTPLGVLNNTQKNVIVVFDRTLQGQRIGIHPLVNTATVFLAFEDVVDLIKAHGNDTILCDLK